MTAQQLADALQLNAWTLRRYVYKKQIPAIKLGGSVRFDYFEVVKALKGKKDGTG